MEHIDEPSAPGMVPIGAPMSSDLLVWVENPWRRNMLWTHLKVVATGSAASSEVTEYLTGLSALAETHNIEPANRVLPSVMYVPRFYARAEIDETQDARGLEWFTEEQVATLEPSLFVRGLTMPIVSSSFIMQSGAAATVFASEAPRDRRWHVIQGPYHQFPFTDLRMRDISKDWGMLPLLVPGAHVLAPFNLLQLARKMDGPMPFRLGYASSARMLVGDFNTWFGLARESGVIVSIHRLHPRDIEVLLETEYQAALKVQDSSNGRWCGPFDHFASREVSELLLSAGVRVGRHEDMSKKGFWIQALEGAISSLRHHVLKEWNDAFSTSWMGGSEFELNPLRIKMGVVVASLAEVGLQRVKKGHCPSYWLEQMEKCTGSFAELQLWYGQLTESGTYKDEVDLASEVGPYPLNRFVSEWGKLPGLKRWLEDGDGESVELTESEIYKMSVFSNRALKKVFCISQLEKSDRILSSADVSLTFVEWLRKAEATFEVSSRQGSPAVRRRSTEHWITFRSRRDLELKLREVDESTLLTRTYEDNLLPAQWKPELQATLIEILGLVLRQWRAPFAPLCVHQFIEGIRDVLGFRDDEKWEETLEFADHLPGAELDYLVDIWWPEALHVYRTELSWVLEVDHGIGLIAEAREGDDRIHRSTGFEIVRYASGFPVRIGWARHGGGIAVGTDALESLFEIPSSTTPLRLARPHCAAEAWASADLKDLLANSLGVTFEFHLGADGTLPMIELRGPKRRLKSLLRFIPGFSAAGVGYTPPPALTNEERRTGQCWVWTQAQLRGLAKNHCEELHYKVGIPWDGNTHVLARAAADAVVVWGVVEHGLKCSVTGGGDWLPQGRKSENGFCWDQPLELGPASAVYHSGSNVFLLVTSDKALQWKKCVVSREETREGVRRPCLTPREGAFIVAVGSGEKPDGAFRRPLARIQVGASQEDFQQSQ